MSKKPCKKTQFSVTPTLPRGYPPFCQMGLLLLGSITNTLEGISVVTIQYLPALHNIEYKLYTANSSFKPYNSLIEPIFT